MEMLKKPITINQVELSNRLVMPPIATAKSGANGEVSQELCDYYAGHSNGGYIGLIILENSYISREGQSGNGQLSVAKDSDVQGLQGLVSVIHQNGTKVVAQLNHAGAAAKREITGCEVFGASAVPVTNVVSPGHVPKEMTQADIDKLIADFAQAARRAKQAGFDGVEIHAAHGYLLSQFYSPLSNKRTDSYNGNSLEGRIKIHLEIIQAVRDAVGEDYLVALRFGASDYTDGGATIQDSIQAAIAFEKAGVDLLDISGGFCGFVNPHSKEQGHFSELSGAIKKNVSIPVVLTGGIVDAQAAEKLLEEGHADLVGVGRAILKDAEWAKNAMSQQL